MSFHTTFQLGGTLTTCVEEEHEWQKACSQERHIQWKM